jgi:hypothetical protein
MHICFVTPYFPTVNTCLVQRGTFATEGNWTYRIGGILRGVEQLWRTYCEQQLGWLLQCRGTGNKAYKLHLDD